MASSRYVTHNTLGSRRWTWRVTPWLCDYTVSQKNIPLLSKHNFGKRWPIFAAWCYAKARLTSSCGVCLCVCLSVTFVSCVKTNKHIIKIFSPSGSHAIIVFPAKRHGNIPTGPPPLMKLIGASNASGVGRNRDSEPISGLTARVNAATGRCCKHGRRWTTATVSQVMTHRW